MRWDEHPFTSKSSHRWAPVGGDDFKVDVLRFHTCLTDILGFLEKFRWWFEQDIGGESEYDKKKKLVMGFAAVLAVLITGASQSTQHGKSKLDLTSHLLQSLFDVGSGRISIVIVNTLVSL
ncbi:hypothetical protein Tco_0564913 [Tanacetum coccineum]